MATPATFLTTSITSVSSLDTGRIGYFTAWGGSEYGYSYTYALSGPPTGVTIGSDTGILSLSIALAPATYTLTIIATNRIDPTAFATFTYPLVVVQGVTSGRTGIQILHKTYNPDSGAYGTPTGTDYTAVFQTMQAAIISDQTTAGDERLRANIILKRGNLYQVNGVSNPNSWLTGIQYYDLSPDPAFPSGAIPAIQNISNNSNEYEDGPLLIGGGIALDHFDPKTLSATIATVAAGTSPTPAVLTALAGASNIKPGRWHVMCGNSQQVGGFPPNCTYIDYVKVVSVVGNTITLDRPLKYRYDQNWYEDSTDGNSFGVARLVPWDTGGSGGLIPADPRMSFRGRFTSIEFRTNPNFTSGSILPDICYYQSHIDIQFDSCITLNATPSMNKHVFYINGQIKASEFDKFMETLVMLNVDTKFPAYDPIGNNHVAGLHAATGVQWLFSRQCSHGCMQISPRQLLIKGSTVDSRGDTFLQVPFSSTAQGPLFDYRFMPFGAIPTQFFSGGQDGGVWAFAGNPLSDPAIIGTDLTWNDRGSGANVLFIPVAYAKWTLWMESIWEGMILYQANTSTFPVVTNWGYISSLSSPGDGTGIYANVVWVNGTKPTSGNLYPNGRARVLVVDSTTVFNAPCIWSDPMFLAEHTLPFGPSYTFPAGYPLPENPNFISGFGRATAQSQSRSTPTVVHSGSVFGQGLSLSVSKGQGALSQLATGGTTITFTNVTGTFP